MFYTLIKLGFLPIRARAGFYLCYNMYCILYIIYYILYIMYYILYVLYILKMLRWFHRRFTPFSISLFKILLHLILSNILNVPSIFISRGKKTGN